MSEAVLPKAMAAALTLSTLGACAPSAGGDPQAGKEGEAVKLLMEDGRRYAAELRQVRAEPPLGTLEWPARETLVAVSRAEGAGFAGGEAEIVEARHVARKRCLAEGFAWAERTTQSGVFFWPSDRPTGAPEWVFRAMCQPQPAAGTPA